MKIVQVRNAKLIAELNQPVQDYHVRMYPDFFKPYNREAVTAYFERAVESENHWFGVCYEEEEPLGFIWYEEIEKSETPFNFGRKIMYVHMMSVNEKSRGKGVGKALIDHVEAKAKSKGIPKIELDFWMKNDGAKLFYEKLGFVVRKETAFKIV